MAALNVTIPKSGDGGELKGEHLTYLDPAFLVCFLYRDFLTDPTQWNQVTTTICPIGLEN